MRRRSGRGVSVAAIGLLLLVAGGAQAAERGGLFGLGRELGGKGPVVVTSRALEYDYKRNVVVYRGGVDARQGAVRLRCDELTIRLAKRPGQAGPGQNLAVQEVVAAGAVRIDQGARWATGGRATFDQTTRTFVLTESPVLHDGPNEIAGSRVVVYLDEDRSVVEGGSGRVKAVLFPDAAGAPGPDAERR